MTSDIDKVPVLHSVPLSATTRVELEINRGWAEEHPALFTASVWRFLDAYHFKEYKLSVRNDVPYYVTFVAQRREE